MNKKPIYLIVTSFFPEPDNWRCPFAYDYVRAIERDGRYQPVVFKPGASYEYNGIKVHGFKSLCLPSALPCPFLRPYNIRLFWNAFLEAGFNVENVAIAESYTNGRIPVLMALKKKNPRIIVAAHHHDPASSGLFDGRFRHLWLIKLLNYFERRKAYESADLHLFISEMVKHSLDVFPDTSWSFYDEYRRLGKGIGFLRPFRLKNKYVIHNGVDTRIFRKKENAIEVKHHSTFTIGCIGNFVLWKGQRTLIEAVSKLKFLEQHIQVVFVGSGPEKKKCQQMAQELGIDAVFRNEVKHEELATFYNSLDLFVLPSYFEGFGCVLTEAWASGVPFITCEGQGMDDFIAKEDRATWLFPPMNSRLLAEKITNYIEKRPVQELVDEIEIDRIMARYLDYVETLRKENNYRK